MPTVNVTDAFAAWLATPPATGRLVETLEITGRSLGSPVFICNRSASPLSARDENGVPRVFLPLDFTISKPAIRNTSEFSSQVRLDAIDGSMIRLFSQVRSSDLLNPVFATYRLYVDPTMLDRPVWLAPLRFRCENVKITLDVIEMDLVGGRLPTKRAGLYYVLERFEGLRPY